MSCHARRIRTVCAAQGLLIHAFPDIVQPCLRFKGYNGMACPTSFDRVCCPKAVMSCHAQRSQTICAAQGRLFHASPDVVIPCLLSKGGYVMPHPALPTVCAVQVGDVVSRPTLPTVCVVKGR